ncbi:50S ribosome-binding GTPase [bacterium]|nr:50S ribosome-binding GTPase [bacterium]MCB2179398.1 50S ribosome-binding GTPase [bacterium]
MTTINIALAGNPNAGKTTLFNSLTGDNQHTGNWPGKTVQQKTGNFEYKDYTINIIDLPGVYSLSSYSPEEEVTRDYLVNEEYDMVINVVDTSNLERNLYLTVQIKEIGVPMMLLLNKIDLSERKGYKVDNQALSHELDDIPVLQSAALKGKGLAALKDAMIDFYIQNQKAHPNEILA